MGKKETMSPTDLLSTIILLVLGVVALIILGPFILFSIFVFWSEVISPVTEIISLTTMDDIFFWVIMGIIGLILYWVTIKFFRTISWMCNSCFKNKSND